MGALQTEGPISLDDIHVEVHGTTGTICSIDDADIRELIPGKDSGDFMSFSMFYGLAAPVDTQVVTVGLSSSGTGIGQKVYRGYSDPQLAGSIDSGNCAFKNFASIHKLCQEEALQIEELVFELPGNHLSNPGFFRIDFNNDSFHIDDIKSSNHLNGYTTWRWDCQGLGPFGFAGSGYDVTVIFR